MTFKLGQSDSNENNLNIMMPERAVRGIARQHSANQGTKTKKSVNTSKRRNKKERSSLKSVAETERDRSSFITKLD